MKITAIKAQVKRAGRYSIFVDDKYSFSLSDTALLESKVVNGQELTEQQLRAYKELSDDDKVYGRVLNYVALRPRSEWEIRFYMERKKTPPPLIDQTLNKLSIMDLINDLKYAESFVRDRRLLRPTSRRKMMMELKKKRVSEEIIQEALGSEPEVEQIALQELIVRKRRQSKYADNTKLMQYLAGQGFNYGDIKAALQQDDTDY
ncbi:MAG: RecX family transcriptional regulator, partial [Patescibacteria group bacterium]|nr:RecX family transcriptional regulator [Patescibacteria group bacterium]